ncbi:MAG: tetraacyldisaccharide 4'-kinase, partial [Betaproteobacteria bacterium]|nr:tetraacyldisaccharide 4'-kinase [Betaproteobacteria bacterium]
MGRNFWRRRGVCNFALLPAAVVFAAAAAARRKLYAAGVFAAARIGAPVVVAGNITAGGGGKTPLVAALVEELRRRGFYPGIAARGYGGKFSGVLEVNQNTPWTQCGDEPLLLFRRTGAPVCVGKNRVLAARALAKNGCDVVVCDDGLQHYALARDMEICAVNAEFGLGNGMLLPAGPLREGAWRLDTCGIVAVCGAGGFSHPKAAAVKIKTDGFFSLQNWHAAKTAADFFGQKTAALAGIASPRRFFDSLRAAGIVAAAEYPLPDHKKMD